MVATQYHTLSPDLGSTYTQHIHIHTQGAEAEDGEERRVERRIAAGFHCTSSTGGRDGPTAITEVPSYGTELPQGSSRAETGGTVAEADDVDTDDRRGRGEARAGGRRSACGAPQLRHKRPDATLRHMGAMNVRWMRR